MFRIVQLNKQQILALNFQDNTQGLFLIKF